MIGIDISQMANGPDYFKIEEEEALARVRLSKRMSKPVLQNETWTTGLTANASVTRFG